MEDFQDIANIANIFLEDDKSFVVTLANAALFGDLEVVNMLLGDDSVDPCEYDNEALKCASFNGQIEILNRLLEDGRVDPSFSDNEVLRIASMEGHVIIVDRLLKDYRVKPTENAIINAILRGHLDVLNRLLEDERVEVYMLNSGLIEVLENGNLDILNRLLEDERVDPSSNNNYALRYAIMNDNIEIVKLLLDNRLRDIRDILDAISEEMFDELLKDKSLLHVLEENTSGERNKEVRRLLRNNVKGARRFSGKLKRLKIKYY